MLRTARFATLALLLVACDDGDTTDAGPGGFDSGPGDVDSGPGDVDGGNTDAGGDTDAGDGDAGAASCGDQRPDISGITGTEGVIIARDGTIYYSQNGGVGRLSPGGSPENSWASLSGASTIWGLVLNAANDTLYVGSPGNQQVYIVDVSDGSSTAITGAGRPNGLTLGPDGALYWSDFGGGQVMRNDLTGGASTMVTTSTVPNANGIAFADDGTLYVASYSTGNLWQLTLAAGVETGRTMVATGLGAPDGVAFDANGDVYVTDNVGGNLVRVVGGAPTTIDSGISAAASVEFGAGPLTCTDIYVASSGTLRRYEMGTVAGRAVPWH